MVKCDKRITFPDLSNKHIGGEKGEFWVIQNTDSVDGPFPTIEEAQGSLEDWELHRPDVRIVRTVLVCETEVIYNTKWNKV